MGGGTTFRPLSSEDEQSPNTMICDRKFNAGVLTLEWARLGRTDTSLFLLSILCSRARVLGGIPKSDFFFGVSFSLLRLIGSGLIKTFVITLDSRTVLKRAALGSLQPSRLFDRC